MPGHRGYTAFALHCGSNKGCAGNEVYERLDNSPWESSLQLPHIEGGSTKAASPASRISLMLTKMVMGSAVQVSPCLFLAVLKCVWA
eukprot:737607-Amphidinium_carterae.1